MDKYLMLEAEAREAIEGRNGKSFEGYVSDGRLRRLRIMGPRPGIYMSETLFMRAEVDDLVAWLERRARRRAET